MLTDKKCLITGASKGIGKETAELFAKNGALVYANAREKGSLEEWVKESNKVCSGKIIPLYFDLTDSESIKEAVKEIKKSSKTLDVLVNNAGVVSNELFGTITKNNLRHLFEVNVFGQFELTQYIVSKFMVRQNSGSVINIASAVAVEGCAGQVAYSASKGAIISMSKSLAKEVAPKQIRVNAIAPGMIGTERILHTVEEQYKGSLPEIGMKRLGEPKDVASTCLFLASDYSSYITGQVIVVGGGIKL